MYKSFFHEAEGLLEPFMFDPEKPNKIIMEMSNDDVSKIIN
jgi:hypothetical protein